MQGVGTGGLRRLRFGHRPDTPRRPCAPRRQSSHRAGRYARRRGFVTPPGRCAAISRSADASRRQRFNFCCRNPGKPELADDWLGVCRCRFIVLGSSFAQMLGDGFSQQGITFRGPGRAFLDMKANACPPHRSVHPIVSAGGSIACYPLGLSHRLVSFVAFYVNHIDEFTSVSRRPARQRALSSPQSYRNQCTGAPRRVPSSSGPNSVP